MFEFCTKINKYHIIFLKLDFFASCYDVLGQKIHALPLTCLKNIGEVGIQNILLF